MRAEREGTDRPVGTARIAILLITLGVVLLLTYDILRPFILTFAMAAPIALLLFPTQERLAVALGRRRSLAAALIVAWTFCVVAVPLTAGFSLLGSQAVGFVTWLGPQLEPERIQSFFRVTLPARVPWFGPAWEAVEPYIGPIASSFLTQVSAGVNELVQRIATGVGSTVMGLLLFFLFLFFLLRDGADLAGQIRTLSPLSRAQESRVIHHLEQTVRGALLGILVVPLAQGLLATAGYTLFGVPNAVLWGALTVLAAIIPILGAPLAWFPIFVYLLFVGPTWRALAFFVYGVIVISGIDNVIKPLLLSGTARVHPLLGFLAVLGGTFAFGPAGLLVGPVVLSLALSALHIYRTEYRRERFGSELAEEGS